MLVLTPVLVGVGLYFGIAKQPSGDLNPTLGSGEHSLDLVLQGSSDTDNVARSGQPTPGIVIPGTATKLADTGDNSALTASQQPQGLSPSGDRYVSPPTLSGASPDESDPSGSKTSLTTQQSTTTSSSDTLPSSSSTATTVSGSTQTSASAGGHNAIELEIFRLTNAIRADPAGQLARQGSLPDCVNDGFYQIEIDPNTGHPTPAPPLTLDETVSLQMSRPWSVQMDRVDKMSHRNNQIDFLESIGVTPRASGENVAWSSGYQQSEAAMVHFSGWRQSSTGHYCAMLSPVYTHIGVGHHIGNKKFWATQNFYRLR